MAHHPLPIQPPLFPPEAEEYSRRALALSADATAHCDVRADIAYNTDPRQNLDIYRPHAPLGHALPVLLFVHGGGWTNGYKEWVGLLGPSVTAFPALLVCVSHRLAPANRFPAPFEDCVAAIRWVYDHIAEFGGDPEQIFVGGHASGGHLITLATLRINELTASRLPKDVIRACFPVSGRFNMVFGTPVPGSAEHRHQSVLFTPGQDPIPASPLHQIRKCKTSFLLTYGSDDIPSIIKDNEQMLAALKARGVRAERLILDGCNHFDTGTEIRHLNSPWMQAVRRTMLKEFESTVAVSNTQ